MFILRRQTKENLRKQYLVRDEKGFGLLEALISAILLAIMIATSVTVTNKYQALNYRSSLRQAIAQTIDEDLTEIRLELENYLYQPKTQSLGACYASNEDCQQSKRGVGTCDRMAGLAANYSAIIKSGIISLDSQTHQIFEGLKNNQSSDLKRIISIETPDAPRQVGQKVDKIDKSIVRIQYTVEGDFANVLFDSSSKRVVTSVDLSPPAHGSCHN